MSWRRVNVLFFVWGGCFCLMLPFGWMVILAIRNPAGELTLENLYHALEIVPFLRFFWNSAFTSILSAFLQVGVGVFLAYALVWIPARFSKVVFAAVVISLFIPLEMKLLPNYLFVSRVGWTDTYWALIIPPAAHGFPVLVLYYNFKTIPQAFLDAAKMEGAGHLRILSSVVLPQARPALAAAFLLAVLGRWEDYLWPLIVTNSESMRTLTVGLAYLRSSEGAQVDWGMLMAGSLIVVFPILVLFWAAQRYFLDGIRQGGLTG